MGEPFLSALYWYSGVIESVKAPSSLFQPFLYGVATLKVICFDCRLPPGGSSRAGSGRRPCHLPPGEDSMAKETFVAALPKFVRSIAKGICFCGPPWRSLAADWASMYGR